jgi:dolichyl-phosphate beta-glucosyltransferase
MLGWGMSQSPHISLIVPSFNEEERLPASLAKLLAYLDESGHDAEIVVVDDGSTDGTAAIVENESDQRVRLLKNPGNRGKGYSVRHGMLEARGAIRIFTDADLSTPVEEVDAALKLHGEGYDVAAGSRSLAESNVEIRQPWYRQTMGRTFNLFVRMILLRGFVDTQCGFKSFTAEAAERVFASARIDGFAFDVEILLLARRLGMRIIEFPVRWLNSPDSKVNPLTHSSRMFMDLLRIRFDMVRGAYRL